MAHRSLSDFDLLDDRKKQSNAILRRQNTSIGLITLATSSDLEVETSNLEILQAYRENIHLHHRICTVSSSGQISTVSTRLVSRRKETELLKESMNSLSKYLTRKRSPRLQRKISKFTQKMRKSHPELLPILDEIDQHDPLITLKDSVNSRNLEIICQFPPEEWSESLLQKLLLEDDHPRSDLLMISRRLLEAWLKKENTVLCLRETSRIVQLPQFWLSIFEGKEWLNELAVEAIQRFNDGKANTVLAGWLFRKLLIHIRNWPPALMNLFRMFNAVLQAENFEMINGCQAIIWICIFRFYLPEMVLIDHPPEFRTVIKICVNYCRVLPPDCVLTYQKTLNRFISN